jgi:hypothetical protein
MLIDLPRYQITEEQESLHLKNNGVLHDTAQHKHHFKPLYYCKDSKPCQCSACVGAITAIITPVRFCLYNTKKKKGGKRIYTSAFNNSFV